MKKQEAIDFIVQEIANGTDRQEIVETLLSQDKIGNATPTMQLVESLFPTEQTENSTYGCNYEEWLVRVAGDPSSKVEKIRDVSITDSVAAILNTAKAQGIRGYKMYIKK